eukprot:6178707-Pleurochrysis_carterae.AAC.1
MALTRALLLRRHCRHPPHPCCALRPFACDRSTSPNSVASLISFSCSSILHRQCAQTQPSGVH